MVFSDCVYCESQKLGCWVPGIFIDRRKALFIMCLFEERFKKKTLTNKKSLFALESNTFNPRGPWFWVLQKKKEKIQQKKVSVSFNIMTLFVQWVNEKKL